MLFNDDRVNDIKHLLQKESLDHIITFLQKSFPNEGCGFFFDNGQVQAAHNVIETLGDKSLNSKNAFLIDQQSITIAQHNKHQLLGIYHSHTNGDADMSSYDLQFLRWHDLCYLIVGIVDHNPISAKLFWWDDAQIRQLDLNIREKTNENT
jgi:proteasome lid subunit RPN8/RPN11